MKKNGTELVFILDKSGSMAGLESDTIGGFNAFLEKQRKTPGDCRVTTVLFDSRIEFLHDRIDLQAVSPMTDRDYIVGGCTALLDAVGTAIEKLVRVQKNSAREYRAEKVIFVIITDGAENSSRRYHLSQIKEMIETERLRYGWEFIFLGANIDAVQTASCLGIRRDRAADYVPDSCGTTLNYEMMAQAVAEFRTTSHISDDHFKTIRQDAERRGKKR